MGQRIFPAEWARQSGVAFTFPHANSDWGPYLEIVIPTFVEIITLVSRYEKVLVVCQDAELVSTLLKDAVQENLILVELPSNDTWARDHSAITILEEGHPSLLDFIFNGWGLKFPANHDNLITKRLQAKGIFGDLAVHTYGLAIEGGALESDGTGTLLTTSECLLSPNRNPHLNREMTENTLRKFLVSIDSYGSTMVIWPVMIPTHISTRSPDSVQKIPLSMCRVMIRKMNTMSH